MLNTLSQKGRRKTARSVVLRRSGSMAAIGLAALGFSAADVFAQTVGNVGNITTVTGGTISVTNTAPGPAVDSTITLDQSRTILDWNAFNLQNLNSLDFIFGANSDIVINRIGGLTGAQINGVLRGCVVTCATTGGNVWIFSNNGVLFGANAQVNVGGLLAGTANLTGWSNEVDFLAGAASVTPYDFQFTGSASTIQIDNGATITGSGLLGFIAPQVNNAGTITSTGDVLFGAATNYTLTLLQNSGGTNPLEMFKFDVTSAADGTNSLTPLTLDGTITGARVWGVAVTAAGIGSAVISAPGTITATSANLGSDGSIILSGGSSVGVGATGVVGGRTVDITSTKDITAAGDLTVRSSGKINLNKISGVDVSVISSGDNVSITSATIADDGNFEATTGALTIESVTLTGDATDPRDLKMKADGKVTLGAATVAGIGATNTYTRAAVGTTTLTSTSSDVIVNLNTSANLGTISAGKDALITVATGNLDVVSVTAGDDVDLTATAGSATVRSVALTGAGAGRDLSIKANTDVTLGAGTAGGITGTNVFTRAGTGTTALTSTTQNVRVNLDTTANLGTLTSGKDTLVSVKSSDLTIESVNSAQKASITATTGSATVRAVALTGVGAGNDLTIKANTNIILGADTEAGITAPNAFTRAGTGTTTLTSTTDSVLVNLNASGDLGTIVASKDALIVVNTGNLDAVSVTGGRDVTVKATAGTVTATTISVGNDFIAFGKDLSAGVLAPIGARAGSATITDIDGDLDLAGGTLSFGKNVTIEAKAGSIIGDGNLVATTGTVTAKALTDIKLGGVTAGDDALITATNGSATVRAVALTGAGAGRDLTITANKDVTLGFDNDGGITAANAFTRAGTGTTTLTSTTQNVLVNLDTTANLGTISAAKDVLVSVTTSDLTIESVTSGQKASITATTGSATVRAVALTGVGAGNDLTIKANKDVTLGADTEAGITATNVVTRAGTGATSLTSDNQSVKTNLNASVNLGTVSASKDALIVVKTGNLDATSVTGGRDVTLKATNGNVAVTTVSVGKDYIAFGKDLSAGVLAPSGTRTGSATITDTDGDLDLTGVTVTFGQNVTVEAIAGSILGNGKLVATAGTVKAKALNNLSVESVTVGDDASIIATTGSAKVRLVALTGSGAGHDLTITANQGVTLGADTEGGIDATKNVFTRAGTGATTLTSTTQDVVVNLNSSANLGTINAATNALIAIKTGDLLATSVTGGNDVTLKASGGDVSATTVSVGNNYVAFGNALKGGVGNTIGARLGTATLTANIGDLDLTGASLAFGGSVTVTANGGSILGNGNLSSSAGSVTATAKTNVSLGDIVAGDDASVTATDGFATVRSVNLTGVGAGKDLTIAAKMAVTLGADTEAGIIATNTFVRAGTGTTSLTSTDDSVKVNLNASADLGTINVKNDALITVATGDLNATSVTGGRDVTVKATNGNVKVATVSVGNDYVAFGKDFTAGVLAPIGLKLGSVTITDIDGDFDLSTATLNFGKNVTVTATNGSIIGNGDLGAKDGTVTATALNDVKLGNVAASDDVLIMATNGSATVRSVALTGTGAGRDLTITANKDIILGADTDVGILATNVFTRAGAGTTALTSTTQSVLVNLNASSDLGTISASKDALVTVKTGNLDAASVTAGRDVDLVAGGGNVKVTTVQSGDDTTVSALNGTIDVGTVTATGLGSDTSGPASLADAGTALGSNISLTSKGATKATTLLAANTITATSTAGSVAITTATATTKDVIVSAATDATVGTAKAGNDVLVTAGGGANVGSATAGRDVIVGAGGGAIVGTGDAGRDLTISAGSDATLGTGKAGRDGTLTSSGGNAKITTSLTVGDDATVSATSGTIDVGTITATGLGSDTSGSASTADTGATLGSNITLTSKGATKGTTLLAARTITATSSAGSVDIINATATTKDVIVSAFGDATVGTAKAGNDVLVTAGGGANVTNGDAGRDLVLNATKNLTLGTGKAGRDGTLTSSGGNAKITTSLTVGDDATVSATGGTIDVGTITATGLGSDTSGPASTADAGAALGSNITLTSKGAITATTLSALQDITATTTTAGAITIATATAGDDIKVSATGGDATVTTAMALNKTGTLVEGNADISVISTTGKASLSTTTGVTGGDVVVDGKTFATAGTIFAGRDLIVTANLNDATLTTGTAGRDVFVGAGGAATVNSGDAVRDLTITAVSSATLGIGKAGRDGAITSTTGNAKITTSLTVGDDASVSATNGTIDVGAITATGLGADTSGLASTADTGTALGANITLTSNGTTTATTLLAANSIKATSAAGSVLVTSATATKNDVIVFAFVDATIGTAKAGNDVLVTALNDANVTNGDAGRDLLLSATKNVTLGTGKAGRDGTLTSTTGNAVITTSLNVGDDATVSAANGSINVGDITTALASRTAQYSDSEANGSNITLNGKTGITAQTLTALDDARLTTGVGNITVKSVSAGDDIYVTAGSSGKVRLSDVRSRNDGTTSLDSDGVGTVDVSGNGRNVIVSGQSVIIGTGIGEGGPTTANTLTLAAPTNVVIEALGPTGDAAIRVTGNAAITSIKAPRDVLVEAIGGSSLVTFAQAGKNLTVLADLDAKLRSATVSPGGLSLTVRALGGDAVLGADFGTTATSAANTLNVDGAVVTKVEGNRDATINLASNVAGTLKVDTITAKNRDASVQLGTGDISITSIEAGDDVFVTASGGSVTLQTVRMTAAGPDSDSDGAGTTDNANAVRRGVVRASGGITLGTTANKGVLDLASPTTTAVSLIAGSGDISVIASTPIILTRAETKGGAITLNSDKNVDVRTLGSDPSGLLTLAPDKSISVTAGTSATIADVTSADQIIVTAKDDATISTAKAATAVSVTAGQSATLTGVTSGSSTTVSAGANATLTNVKATSAVAVTASQNATLNAVTSGTSTSVNAGNASLTNVSAGTSLAVTATTNAILNAVSSGTTTTISGATIALTNVTAGTSLTSTSGATTTLNNVTAGTAITTTSGSSVTFNNVKAGTDLISVSKSTIIAGATEATNDATIRTNSLSVNAALKAGNLMRLESGVGNVSVGGTTDDTATTMAVTDAEFARISAKRLDIYAGDTTATVRGDINVGNLTVSAANIGTLALYAAAGKNVDVSGAIVTGGAGTDGANQADIIIGGLPSWTPTTVPVTGSIGAATVGAGGTYSGIAAFRSVELNALGAVIIGTPTFVTSVTGIANGEGIDVSRNNPPSNPSVPNKIFITTGRLTVRAGDRIVQQDTSPVKGVGRGIYITNPIIGGTRLTTPLIIGRSGPIPSSGVSAPLVADLFGVVIDGTGNLISGRNLAASPAVAIEAGVLPNPRYRINSCSIGQTGTCTALTDSIYVIEPSALAGGIIFRAPEPFVESDPSVTSSGNEEIWRDGK
jgi:filamentous hemagglutinin family protein